MQSAEEFSAYLFVIIEIENVPSQCEFRSTEDSAVYLLTYQRKNNTYLPTTLLQF